MKHTIFKIFTVAQHEQEEQWLNEMSEKGLQLLSVGWGYYRFEDGPAGQYHYKIELLPHCPSHAESLSYIGFLRDMGIECVAAYLNWVYFRKKTDSAPFVLYSDIPSNIKHYERVLSLCRVLYLVNFFAAIVNAFAVMERIFSGAGSYIPTINGIVSIFGFLIAGVVFAYSRPMSARLKKMRRETAVRE